MSAWLKFLIGLGAALLAGWISHGPLGRGEALVARLEAQAKAAVRDAELPGIEVRLERDPLSRQAILSGPANEFQREGQGLFPGLNDRVGGIAGISGVHWDEAPCCAEGG